jgi:hypothetical protein
MTNLRNALLNVCRPQQLNWGNQKREHNNGPSASIGGPSPGRGSEPMTAESKKGIAPSSFQSTLFVSLSLSRTRQMRSNQLRAGGELSSFGFWFSHFSFLLWFFLCPLFAFNFLFLTMVTLRRNLPYHTLIAESRHTLLCANMKRKRLLSRTRSLIQDTTQKNLWKEEHHLWTVRLGG